MAKSRIQKRPRDNPENLTQITKQIKLNDYWLYQPSPIKQKQIRRSIRRRRKRRGGGKDKKKHLQSTTNICGWSPKYPPLKDLLLTVTGDDFEIKVLNGNQVKIQPKSKEKYTTIIKALAEKRTEFHTYRPKGDGSFRTAQLHRHKRNRV
jgi:hypothetical protein